MNQLPVRGGAPFAFGTALRRFADEIRQAVPRFTFVLVVFSLGLSEVLSGGVWTEALFLRGFCFLGGILSIWGLGRLAGANGF
jgi:hypothetical protein